VKNKCRVHFVSSLVFAVICSALCRGQANQGTIKIAGVYYTFQEYPAYDPTKTYLEFLFFYSDGTVAHFVNPAEQNGQMAQVRNILNNINEYRYIAKWGYYTINHDSITAKIFLRDRSRLGKITEEWHCLIATGDTIYVTKTVCDRCKNQYLEYGQNNAIVFQPMKKYQFEPSITKLDSSETWLRKKKWFQRELKN